MEIWILRPEDEYGKSGHYADSKDDDPWDPWYDKCFGVVAHAPSEEEARRIAGENARRPPSEIWESEKYVRCIPIEEYAEQEGPVLITDVHHA